MNNKFTNFKFDFENEFILDKSDLLNGPLHVSFDITNKCNARCLHCYNRSGNELPREELTDEELLDTFRQIAEIKPFSICYCGGEPMTRWKVLVEGTKILNEAGVENIGMVSNGWYINEENVKQLHEAGLKHIQISLDGCKAETHERMRGVKGIFDKAINAMNIISNSGLTLAVAFSPTKFNLNEFPDVIELVSQFKSLVQIRIQPLMPMGKALKGDEELFPEQDDYREILKFINKYNNGEVGTKKAQIEWGDPIDHLIRFSSKKFKNAVFAEIKSDGSIAVSAYLPIRIGNVKRHTIKEYWDAGSGKMWTIPAVHELASYLTSIGDMRSDDENVPTIFYEDNIEIDIIDDKVFENLEEFTLEKLWKRN